MNSQYKILIVEDEFIIANQIKDLLQLEGYYLLETADCYCTAIAQIEKELPDLIITDLKLYDDANGGIKISKYVSEFFNIPIIFLSGYSDDDTLKKVKATNPSAFLIKPKSLDNKQLVTTIKMVLPNKKELNNIPKIVAIKGREVDEKDIEKKTFSDLMTYFIVYEDIIFIETSNHFVKNTLLIHFNIKSNPLLVRDEIENMMNRLPSYFIRVHKSYIINSKIISGHKFPNYILCNGYTVPIGEKFKDDVKTILQVKLDFVP